MKYPSLDEIFVAVKGHVDCFSENVVESIVKNLLINKIKLYTTLVSFELFTEIKVN